VSFSRLSLLWKILLPTSVVLTVVFAVAGWMVQNNVVRTTSASVEHEARGSFQAYKSLWQARADGLATVSRILSTMSDIRKVLGTGDAATIRDTAGEMWGKAAAEDAFFLVCDPRGKVIASQGAAGGAGAARAFPPNEDFPEVQVARARFPEQVSGFVERGGALFQVVITPVYVQAAGGAGLLDVLVAGYGVDNRVAGRLKQETGGSDFVFTSGRQVIASTLPAGARVPGLGEAAITAGSAGNQNRVASNQSDDYLALPTPLLDVGGQRIGQLFILRPFAEERRRIAMLRTEIVALWLTAMAAALVVTFLVARRIMRPVAELDRAAAEIARQNYDYRVGVESGDELGRLATTFNGMCESIQHAREDLTRQERISTIGRLSSSIVHDLRNPLAAIYAGSEMLVDSDLPAPQVRRLAANIYRASRLIQEMLQQLLNASRGRTGTAEVCAVREVISAAWSSVEAAAESQRVSLISEVPDALECPMERERMERVFRNLFENALEAMPGGGMVRVTLNGAAGALNGAVGAGSNGGTLNSAAGAGSNGAEGALNGAAGSDDSREDSGIEIVVKDSGPGIPPGVRARLFQPFVTMGKKNGLGLGLALSRQTLLDHGGDLWLNDPLGSDAGRGAEFHLRLPGEKQKLQNQG
jgi:signal transduction histidine kinase